VPLLVLVLLAKVASKLLASPIRVAGSELAAYFSSALSLRQCSYHRKWIYCHTTFQEAVTTVARPHNVACNSAATFHVGWNVQGFGATLLPFFVKPE
jgi:hypothetical protein